MPTYDFGNLATPVKKGVAKKAYDFGSLATKSAAVEPEESMLSKASTLLGPGLGEAALNAASGLIAKPVSEVAGLAATAKEMVSPTPKATGDEPSNFKRDVQKAMTYEPKTDLGKFASKYNPAALAGNVVGYVGDKFGKAIKGEASDDSLRGMAGNAVGEAVKQAPGLLGARNVIKKTVNPALTPAQETATKTIDQGYGIPPVMGAKPKAGPLNTFFQAVVGDVKTNEGLSLKNERVTSDRIKKEFKIADERPLDVEALQDVRDAASKAYDAVKTSLPELKTTPEYKALLKDSSTKFKDAKRDFPEYFKNKEIDKMIGILSKDKFSSSAAIDMQKVLRQDGYTNLKAFDDTAKQALGEAQLNAAKAIDALIDQNLEMAAPPGVKNFKSKLADNLNESRRTIAKSYAVEGAMNKSTGTVSSIKLARMWEKGEPLSGALLDAATAAKAYPKVFQNVENIQGKAGVSNLDIAKATMMSAAGHGLVAAGSTLLRPLVKPMITSDFYQNKMVRPKQPGPVDPSFVNYGFIPPVPPDYDRK